MKGKLKFNKHLIGLIVIILILIGVVGAFVYYNYFREVMLSPAESVPPEPESLCDITGAESSGGTWTNTWVCIKASDPSNDPVKWGSLCEEREALGWGPCCEKRGGECSPGEKSPDGRACTNKCRWNTCGDWEELDGEECDPPGHEIYQGNYDAKNDIYTTGCSNECKIVCDDGAVNPNNRCERCVGEKWDDREKDELTAFCEIKHTASGATVVSREKCNEIKKIDRCSLYDIPLGKEVTLTTKLAASYDKYVNLNDIDPVPVYTLETVCFEEEPIKCNMDTFLSPCKRNGGMCFDSKIENKVLIDERGNFIAENFPNVQGVEIFEEWVQKGVSNKGIGHVIDETYNMIIKNVDISESAKKKTAKKLVKNALNDKFSKKEQNKVKKTFNKLCYDGKFNRCVEGTETDCWGEGEFCCIPKDTGKQLFDKKRTSNGVDDKGNILKRTGSGFMKVIKFAKDNGLTVLVIPRDGGVYAEIRWRPGKI